jgi:hypothetical protein
VGRTNAKQHVISKYHSEKMMTHNNMFKFNFNFVFSFFNEKIEIKFRPLKKLKEMSMLTTP